MPKVAYSEEEREQIRGRLMTTALELMAKQGIQHTTVEQVYTAVGISRTFFYSFFASKEDLIVEALYLQQSRVVAYARRLMEDPALSWREGVQIFLSTCCYGDRSGVAVLSLEEEQEVYRCLSPESVQAFRQEQVDFYAQLLSIFGVPAGSIDPRLFGNLALAMMMVHRAIPDTMPFLFPEVADSMVEFQIQAMLNEMQRVRDAARMV